VLLCNLPRTGSTSLVRHHEASRGPMATLESLLTSCVTEGCGVSTRAFLSFCTNSPQGTRDHPIQRASCARSAPRRHVLTSTIYAPPHRKHPTLRVLDRSLAHAGCNPEFCRPRPPPPKVHRLLLLTEELLPAPQTAICRSLAELRKRPYGAVRGLMIKVETHAGTVSLLLTLPTN
jgi:hypothetical protein